MLAAFLQKNCTAIGIGYFCLPFFLLPLQTYEQNTAAEQVHQVSVVLPDGALDTAVIYDLQILAQSGLWDLACKDMLIQKGAFAQSISITYRPLASYPCQIPLGTFIHNMGKTKYTLPPFSYSLQKAPYSDINTLKLSQDTLLMPFPTITSLLSEENIQREKQAYYHIEKGIETTLKQSKYLARFFTFCLVIITLGLIGIIFRYSLYCVFHSRLYQQYLALQQNISFKRTLYKEIKRLQRTYEEEKIARWHVLICFLKKALKKDVFASMTIQEIMHLTPLLQKIPALLAVLNIIHTYAYKDLHVTSSSSASLFDIEKEKYIFCLQQLPAIVRQSMRSYSFNSEKI